MREARQYGDADREQLIASSAKAAASSDVWGSLYDEIAAAVDRAKSPADARYQLDKWSRDERVQQAIAETLATPILAAAATGRMRVVTVDAPEVGLSRRSTRDLVQASAHRSGGRVFMLDDPRAVASFALAPQDAIDAFLALGVVTPDEWAQMDAAAREQAFFGARLATRALADRAHAALASALEEGSTLADFRRALAAGDTSLGVTPDDPGYLETVFRTNLSSAYTAGRVAQMDAPLVVEARPYVELSAIIDARTTSICEYLNGLVFDRVNDPGYRRFLPPNHFNCRTDFYLLGEADVDRARLIRSDRVDARGQPQPPFDTLK